MCPLAKQIERLFEYQPITPAACRSSLRNGQAERGDGDNMKHTFSSLQFRFFRPCGIALMACLLLVGCATDPGGESFDTSSTLMDHAIAMENANSSGYYSKDTPSRGPRQAPRVVLLNESNERTFTGIHEPRGQVSVNKERAERAEPFAQKTRAAPLQKAFAEAGASGNDLWARLRRGFLMPDLTTRLVQDREQWYAARVETVQRMAERSSRYLFHIMEEVAQRGMPSELALLPFIESAFNPQAFSSAQAAGIWQFIPTTGSAYDLRQSLFRDDRRAVLASTRAALDYLSKLHKMFGDWHLALAAYNWGEGNVQRAIGINQKNGLPTDYLSLNMPEETRNYVPKLQAIKNLVARPDSYGLRLPAVDNKPYFAAVPIGRDIDIALAIELSGVSHDEFMKLNPQFNSPVIVAATTSELLLPHENASRFTTRLSQHGGRQLASWTAWTAPRTMSLADVAAEIGVSEGSLRQVNAVPKAMLINRGSTVLVPRLAHMREDVPLQIADNATMSLTRATSKKASPVNTLTRRTVAFNSAH
jgi:soluble lytic murein transglycosylase-like protein